MAWTQQDYDNLKAAIATGTKKVKYADKEVEYRSLADMKQTLADIADELGLTANMSRKKYAGVSSGYFSNF